MSHDTITKPRNPSGFGYSPFPSSVGGRVQGNRGRTGGLSVLNCALSAMP
jgi:hypothetical protein